MNLEQKIIGKREIKCRAFEDNYVYIKGDYICIDCGLEHGDSSEGVSTFHENVCGICGEKTSVTHRRHYNIYPISDDS